MALFAEDVIISRLNDAAYVKAIVSNRIMPGAAPQGTRIPHITLNRVSTEHHRHLLAAAGLAQVRVQVDYWADSYLGALELADAARDALDGYHGTTTIGAQTASVKQCKLDVDQTDFVEANDSADVGVFRATHEYIVGIVESVPALT